MCVVVAAEVSQKDAKQKDEQELGHSCFSLALSVVFMSMYFDADVVVVVVDDDVVVVAEVSQKDAK